MYSPDMIFENGMPANTDAERCILGAAVLDRNRWRDISMALAPEDFSLNKHRVIFVTMKELEESGQGIDRVTLANSLFKSGKLESVDGLTYLVSLDEGLPDIINLESYIKIVQDASLLRKAIVGCQAVMQECLSRGSEAPEIIQRLSRITDELQGSIVDNSDFVGGEQIVSEEGLTGVFQEGKEPWMRTPWSRLNQLIGGFEKGQMVLIGGRPSTGKTVILCQCAYDAALEGKNVAFVSIEMRNVAMVQRWVAARAGVPLHKLRGGGMDQEQRGRAAEHLHEYTSMPNLLLTDKTYTTSAVRASLCRANAKRQIDLIVIDYLQLLMGESRGGRVEEASRVSRALKLLSHEFECTVIIGSQLSRDNDRESREPRLSDLRESGCLEQDADLVIFPHALKVQEKPETPRVEFIVAKNRNGRTGRVPMTFQKPYVRFVEE